MINSTSINQVNPEIIVKRLTALWAFSEAALGGILHAFRIPFRGVFIGGSAAILISLIYYFSNKRGTIIKSTLLVILIKGVVSPHTPLTAYLAVFLQGLIGEIIFFNKKFFKLSALILGILTLVLSSVQKLIILTVIFGNTLWESIDEFVNFIVNEFVTINNPTNFRYTYALVGLYIGIHVVIGFMVGLFASRLPFRIEGVIKGNNLEIDSFNNSKAELIGNYKRKHKRWWQRPSGLLIFTFALIMVVLSYTHPAFDSSKAYDIIIMILRAILIMVIWYTLLGPLILKYMRKYLKKKQNIYSSEITGILDSFPHLRVLVSYCWKISSAEKGYRKITSFLVYLTAFILVIDLYN